MINSHLDEKLKEIHIHINDLLKFAEAKNAGLLAFNGVIILEGVKNLYEHKDDVTCVQIIIVAYIMALNIMSFLVCLAAIFPSKRTTGAKTRNKDFRNLLFFGTIATLTSTEYIEQLEDKYKFRPESRAFCVDIARQIIVQSQILCGKFEKFKVASAITFSAFATPIGFLIFKFYFVSNED